MARSCRNPEESALHSWRIGGATTLAAGGDISKRVIQREGRWSCASHKAYTQNNIKGSPRVSRKLAVIKVAKEGQPGYGTIWGGNKHY